MDNIDDISEIDLKNPIYLFIKRLFDFVSSFCLFILLLWLFAIIAILIKKEDGGTVFYRHYRLGKNGKKIGVYKFRSMKQYDGDLEDILTPEQLKQYRTEFKIDNDPRITKIGQFLRKSSLDELPQLINIMKGDLSVVGPRPIVPTELSVNYTENEQSLFLSIKPGLTGYWQAYARNNVTYESGKRQEMEMYYCHNASLFLDIKILFKTVESVFKKSGAH